MAKPILDDELREFIEPYLPPPKPRRFRYPGRKPLDDCQVLTGILFVLKTGISWEDVHRALLARLLGADQIDFSRAVVDSASVRAVLGGASRPQSDGSP